MPPVAPVLPGPGQESVWDYPRPPRVEPTHEHVIIGFDGMTVCETRSALRVLETSHPPTYYLPVGDFAPNVLTSVNAPSICEWKGQADYFDIQSRHDGRVAERAAWGYAQPRPGFESLRGFLAVYAAAMDEITVDGELVVPQPGMFYGGWITSKVVGPFKGVPGSQGW